MTGFRKLLLGIITVLVVAVVVRYIWGGDEPIGVFYRARIRQGDSKPQLEFYLSDAYQLTAVKLVKKGSTDETVWELKGTPVKPLTRFRYGREIDGMQATPASPQPLESGAHYQLFVKAGGEQGEVKFVAP